MIKIEYYRLAEYKISEDEDGHLWWETHSGFCSVKTGRCFVWSRSSIVDTKSIMLVGVVRSIGAQRLPVRDSPVAFESVVDCRTLQCTQ